MKKGFLLAGLLFASAFAVMAEENFYAVPLNGDPVKLDREITLPAVITGRVSSATSKNWVSFEVDRNYGELPAVILQMPTGAPRPKQEKKIRFANVWAAWSVSVS